MSDSCNELNDECIMFRIASLSNQVPEVSCLCHENNEEICPRQITYLCQCVLLYMLKIYSHVVLRFWAFLALICQISNLSGIQKQLFHCAILSMLPCPVMNDFKIEDKYSGDNVEICYHNF